MNGFKAMLELRVDERPSTWLGATGLMRSEKVSIRSMLVKKDAVDLCAIETACMPHLPSQLPSHQQAPKTGA